MAKFEKIEDLLSELYKYRKLFSGMFDKRMSPIQEEMVVSLVEHDTEKLERLAAFDLLFRNQGLISLEPRLQEFFEEFMEVDETVHVLYIQENLDQIKKNQSYYLKENQPSKRDQYLVKIKKHLYRINQTTLQNIKALRDNTDETYKTETNFEIKKEKLTDIRNQRDALEGVIKAVERVLQDDIFFKTAADAELQLIVHRLRLALNDSIHNLIEIQQQIIEYLNHIEKRVHVVEKVLRLKMLRDKHYLKERTNFYWIVGANQDLPLRKAEGFRTRLSIQDMLNEEEKRKLILKVREKQQNQRLLAQNTAGSISDEAFNDKNEIDSVFNYHALKRVFMGKNQDLFSFVMHHQFAEEISINKRIQLYCRLASLFEADFTFSEETGRFENLEYALIYPASNLTTANPQTTNTINDPV
ncbi:hypothetical protein [Mangrovibacterium lignilyticum]|uniref:hypothetical protein n=1 Tax=Mangrovibacterium lignilyticum TaxID=2668052 RepID=UPI0013D669B0|nr:hypothetical protein [Mangrovibacterium lignilyticum]